MAQKKKPRNRASKVKGRLPSKPSKRLPPEVMAVMAQLETVVQGTNFEVASPIVGRVYWGSDAGLFPFAYKYLDVVSCSERGEDGDFQVVFDNEEGERKTLSAKEWECERLIIGNDGTSVASL